MILDGTVLPIDRVAADRPYYSGKRKSHGMNVQVIADPAGPLIRVALSVASVVDLAARRTRQASRLNASGVARQGLERPPQVAAVRSQPPGVPAVQGREFGL